MLLSTTELKLKIDEQLELMEASNYPGVEEVKKEWDEIQKNPYHSFPPQDLTVALDLFYQDPKQMLSMLKNLIEGQEVARLALQIRKQMKGGE